VATIAALVQLARLAVFIVAPAQAAYSQFPSSVFEVRHSCLTAYFVAAQALKTTPNVYDDALSSFPGDPFLLLPRALGLPAAA
jgi:alpha-1,2-mannosyltransferase